MKNITKKNSESNSVITSGGPTKASGETIHLNYRPVENLDLGENEVSGENIVDPQPIETTNDTAANDSQSIVE